MKRLPTTTESSLVAVKMYAIIKESCISYSQILQVCGEIFALAISNAIIDSVANMSPNFKADMNKTTDRLRDSDAAETIMSIIDGKDVDLSEIDMEELHRKVGEAADKAIREDEDEDFFDEDNKRGKKKYE
jgi:hypothetical protein